MTAAVRTRAERALTRTAQRALRFLHVARGDIAVHVLPNRELRALKRRYLRRDARVVDVLAFPEPPRFPHPERKGPFLGEVYLNEGFLRDPVRLRYLLVHGMLHILGYRHSRRRDMMVMERLEKRVLRKLASP